MVQPMNVVEHAGPHGALVCHASALCCMGRQLEWIVSSHHTGAEHRASAATECTGGYQLHAALTCCCRPSSISACCVSDSCRKVLRADCRAQAGCQTSAPKF